VPGGCSVEDINPYAHTLFTDVFVWCMLSSSPVTYRRECWSSPHPLSANTPFASICLAYLENSKPGMNAFLGNVSSSPAPLDYKAEHHSSRHGRT